jgi:hypothetical protein
MTVSEKPIAQRLKEVVEVMKKLTTDLGLPLESPEVQELKGHLDAYVREGTVWEGTVDFSAYGRKAVVNLPKSATKTIEVMLKAIYVPKGKRGGS